MDALADATAPISRASMRVLTNRVLFRRVASFMDGLPLEVVRFAQVERYRPRLEGRYPSSRGLLPQLAIICGNLSVLEALATHNADGNVTTETEFFGVVCCALRFDRLDMLEWLDKHLSWSDYTFQTGVLDTAVGYTDGIAALKWLHARHSALRREVSAWALRLAAYNGEVGKLRWLHEHGFRGFSRTTADDAACVGHVDVLRFLLEHRNEGCSSRALDMAAAHGHLDVVRLLFRYAGGRTDRQRVTARASYAMTKAALCGHEEVVAYLGQHRCTPLNNTLLDVVATGELPVLKALCQFSTEGCLVEARRRAKSLGHVEMVAYLGTQIAPTVWSCRVQRHSRSGPRRCQRQKRATT